MQSRFLKQLIYGVFYLVIFGAIGFGFFKLFLQSAPSCFDNQKNGGELEVDCGGPLCASCELRHLKPIEVTGVSIFNLQDGRVNVLVGFQNPNPGYGAETFAYTLTLFDDSGVALTSLPRTSFIYPGEIKFSVDPGITTSRKPARGEVLIVNPSWKSRDEFPRPIVIERDVTVELRSPRHEAIISGIARNESPFLLSRLAVNVEIAGASSTSLVSAVAAGKTVLETVASGEERPFKVTVPAVFLGTVLREAVSISFEATQ